MKRHHLIGPLLAACAWHAANASAEIITYTVDPARSSLTISGTFAGYPLQAQPNTSGGLTTSYAGTITTNRDFNADTIQITGSAIAAQTSGGYLPPGGLTGDYGIATPTFGSGLDRQFDWATIRDLLFSLSSQSISSPATFDFAQLDANVASGEIDYGYSMSRLVATYSSSMDGILEISPGTGTLVDAGGIETLTLHISTLYVASLPGAPDTFYDLDAQLSGVIVAVSPTPEPGSLAIFGIPLILLFRRSRIKRT